MCDYYIYKNKQQKEIEKEVLNKQLVIKTNISDKINDKNYVDLIEQIYKHCYKEAFYFSWSFNVKNIKYDKDIADDYNKNYEKQIFDHCVIAALFTIQYMLYSDNRISIADLTNKVMYNGHNSILEEKLLEANGFVDIDMQRVIKRTIKKIFDTEGNPNNNYLIRTLGLNIKDVEKNINQDLRNYETATFPLFLSNFSYMSMIKLKKFNSYELIKEVANSTDYRKENINKSNFLSKYYECVKSCSFNHDESLLSQDISFKLTPIDKLLLYYKKERLLNSDLIKYYISKDNGGYINNTDERILNLCTMLPNVFSRNVFIDYFGYAKYEENNDYKNRIYNFSCDSLEFLINGTFPIFEKTFFITFFDYCSNKLKKSLVEMNDILSDYVEKIIFPSIVINDVPVNFKEYFDEKSYEKKSRKKSKVYDILEYSILNTLQINSNNISEFKYSWDDNLKFNMVEEFMIFMKLRNECEEVTPDSILKLLKLLWC